MTTSWNARWPRRQFLRTSVHTSAALGAAALFPRIAWALTRDPQAPPSPHFVLDDPTWRAFAQRGLDAAQQAGAQYADVRLTRTLTQRHFVGGVNDTEVLGVGIRALIDGCWGFSSSPYWHGDESVLLGRMAAQQARAMARVTPRPMTLIPRPVASGTWVMPVRVDPFTLPVEEKRDFLGSWVALAGGIAGGYPVQVKGIPDWSMTFVRQEQAVSTSDGSYVTQVVYRSKFDGPLIFIFDPSDENKNIRRAIQHVGFMGAGWEYLLEAEIPDQIPVLYREALELSQTPRKPAEPGRFDVVFDAATTARLVDRTVGLATELDRALGDEANASGTSFLGPDVMAMLGQQIGAPSVTITGDRSMMRGLATTKWDAEAVEPDMITLVKNGVLTDYQTTRPSASQLAPWYSRQQQPSRSHGCASAASALEVTLQTPPNLTLAPGTGKENVSDLIASVSRGWMVQDADVTTDFQARHGLVKNGVVREIKNGTLGNIIQNAGLLFETTELWKHVKVLGGVASAEPFPIGRKKGQPAQEVLHTVRSVPILVQQVAAIDVTTR